MSPKRAFRKYHALPTMVDGIKFPSKKEAARYRELLILQKVGEIDGLDLQAEFPLTVTNLDTGEVTRIGAYRADFVYLETPRDSQAQGSEKSRRVVEDVKGFKTPVYQLKKRHMRAQYGIEIRET